jgi:hypothetical protein
MRLRGDRRGESCGLSGGLAVGDDELICVGERMEQDEEEEDVSSINP